MSHQSKIASNKLLWDARVPGHVASKFYDVAGFLEGKCTLKRPELEGLGDVSGKTMLHLQCHFGLDTLSWARRGAQVTGVDFSGSAIAQARSLALQTGLEATFIECAIDELPEQLAGQFDIVFVSYGALLWLPNLEHWAEIVCRYLKPGGKICVAEFHPHWHCLNWETYQLQYFYFNQEVAYEEVSTMSYAGSDQDEGLKEYFWNHSLAEILQPLLDRGVALRRFQEFSFSPYNCFPDFVEARPEEWVPRGLVEGMVPIMFLLVGQLQAIQ